MSERQQRDRAGKFYRGIDSVERDTEAAWMKSRGATYQEIADELGYSDRHNARRAVENLLDRIPAQAVHALRTTQLEHLEELISKAFEIMRADHPLVSQGGRIVKKDDGTELQDAGPALAAMDRLVRVWERASKLMGLDAPVRREGVSDEDIDAELARLLAEHGEPGGADREATQTPGA